MSGAWLVIVAAGRGERLGLDRPKAFVELASWPLVTYSLEAGGLATSIDHMIGVGDAARFEALVPLLSGAARGKWRGAVAGGADRGASVRHGCAEVQRQAPEDVVVLVHDAARPFASPSLFDAVTAAAQRGPALAAASVADTVKLRHGDRVQATLDRSDLVLAQTPQGARLSVLLSVQAEHGAGAATDEAALFEAAGLAVTIVPSPATNFKVTGPEDLQLAEAWVHAGGAPWVPALETPRIEPRTTGSTS